MNARIDLFVVSDFFLGVFGGDDGDINKVGDDSSWLSGANRGMKNSG